MEFLVNDNSVNRYGYRIMTEGIDTTFFEKNPIMLFMHDTCDEETLPIGKWTIRKEGAKLFATPEFDEQDEFAQQIKHKVEKGYLNAVSINVEPLTLSSDKKDLLAGQRYETVVTSILNEISFVKMPGNGNATRVLKLTNNDGPVDLPKLGDTTEKEPNSNKNMNKIALSLGLSESATEDQMVAAIESMKLSLKQSNEEKAEALVNTHLADAPDDVKSNWKKLALNDFESTKLALSGLPKVEQTPQQQAQGVITGILSGGVQNSDDPRKDWDYEKWMENDKEGLNAMRLSNDPKQVEKFKNLFKLHYKTEYLG